MSHFIHLHYPFGMKFSTQLCLLLIFSHFGENMPLLKPRDSNTSENIGVGSCDLALGLAWGPRDAFFFFSCLPKILHLHCLCRDRFSKESKASSREHITLLLGILLCILALEELVCRDAHCRAALLTAWPAPAYSWSRHRKQLQVCMGRVAEISAKAAFSCF